MKTNECFRLINKNVGKKFISFLKKDKYLYLEIKLRQCFNPFLF